MSDLATTRLSTKGQVILPVGIRKARQWKPGAELTVEDTPNGVLLNEKQVDPIFPLTRFEDVAGFLKYDGPTVSIEDMDRAITNEVRRRRALGRY